MTWESPWVYFVGLLWPMFIGQLTWYYLLRLFIGQALQGLTLIGR